MFINSINYTTYKHITEALIQNIQDPNHVISSTKYLIYLNAWSWLEQITYISEFASLSTTFTDCHTSKRSHSTEYICVSYML